MAVDHVFGGTGRIFVREQPQPRGRIMQQLLRGDWIRALSRERDADGWLRTVFARNSDASACAGRRDRRRPRRDRVR